MDYSSGDAFGYDQIVPNMQLDNYDSPYSTIQRASGPGQASCLDEKPYRTFLPPTGPLAPASQAGLGASMPCAYGRPRIPMDTDVAIWERGARSRMQSNQTKKEGYGSALATTNPLGSMVAPDISSIEVNYIMLLFIVILTFALIINSVSLRHLTKQVKLLTQRSLMTPS